MLLRIGWMFLGTELILALVCGFVLWYFWTHSAMSRSTAQKALGIYALGCIACLLLALFLPL
jgi:hypothetical protein